MTSIDPDAESNVQSSPEGSKYSRAKGELPSTADHISVGPTLSKYLERMNKSNDQLIKLADLIAKEEERAEAVDPDDIFSKIDK